MDELRFTSELYNKLMEAARKEASTIDPKQGTSVSFNRYFAKSGLDMIKSLQSEAETKKKDNIDNLSVNRAKEANDQIDSKLNEQVRSIKEITRKHINNNVDTREQRIDETRTLPIREGSMKLLQTIKMLIDLNADIPESDWTAWGKTFAGHYTEELVFEAFAKSKGITILRSTDLEKSIERLETFRSMANIAIDHMDNVEDSIMALSFFSDTPDAPINKLIEDIDSDMASIIPAEKLSVLKRLKSAEDNAFDKSNVALSAKIHVFIDRNKDKLATPEELTETLYAEAEELIAKGMTAKKE